LESKGVVTFPVPQEEACDCKEHGECGGHYRVDLLAGVEATLRCSASTKPGKVVIVEIVDLPCRGEQAATVPREQNQCERSQPDEGRVHVNVLEEWSPADQLGEAREIQAKAGGEKDEEGARMNPVKGTFGARKTREAT